MKKNRYLPFGYHIQNGTLCTHEAEATVVRQVFEDYQAGISYRRIAESLTAKGIPYMENRTNWNKHRVIYALRGLLIMIFVMVSEST